MVMMPVRCCRMMVMARLWRLLHMAVVMIIYKARGRGAQGHRRRDQGRSQARGGGQCELRGGGQQLLVVLAQLRHLLTLEGGGSLAHRMQATSVVVRMQLQLSLCLLAGFQQIVATIVGGHRRRRLLTDPHTLLLL